MDNWTEVHHDGFARQSLIRVAIPPEALWRPYKDDERCACCGQLNGYGGLFKYAIVPDDSNRINPIARMYCSVACMRNYAS